MSGGIDGEHVAPVTQLFGAPAAPPSGPAHADSPVPVRTLPTFAAFDRTSTSTSTAEAPTVVDARSRFRAATPATEDEDENPSRARIENVSTAALARRGLSESELRARLVEKGFDADDIEEEIQRLLRIGYLDDRKLADEVIRVEAERKGKGRSAIVAELRRRGVDAEDSDAALEQLDDDGEWERAQDVVRKKLSSLRNVDDDTAKRRLYGALARRGFGGDIVRSVIDEALATRF